MIVIIDDFHLSAHNSSTELSQCSEIDSSFCCLLHDREGYGYYIGTQQSLCDFMIEVHRSSCTSMLQLIL